MRRRLIKTMLASALTAQAAPPPPSIDSGEVTVTGQRLTGDERRDRAAAFIKSTGIAAGERPAARWIGPICLKVVGLPAGTAATVGQRITAIAQAAGARLADTPCKPNAVVAFTDDGGSVVRAVTAKRAASLQEVAPAARKLLLTGDAPVRWWYSTQTRGKDGDPPSGGQSGSIIGEGSAAGAGNALPGNMDTEFQTVRGAGFISNETVRALYAANVVVDIKRLNGVGLDAVTDFAAFVALAEVRSTIAPQPDSILGVFAGPVQERRLTAWDAALLRALYRMPLDRMARLQRGALTAAVIEAGERP